MTGVASTICAHALTCAAAVIIADRVASFRRRMRGKAERAPRAVAPVQPKPASLLPEIERQVELGRASFLSPSFQPKRHDEPDLNEAFERLLKINQELLLFDAMIAAPREEIDVDRVTALWADFTARRQAARDHWQATRRELERCRT